MTHVKLLAWIFGIFLFIFAVFGGFGILVSKILGFILLGVVILGVYFFIHEVIFGGIPGGSGT